ncbi:MAG: hydrogenase maturation protease [Desulfobaccales bacterium]
MDTLLRTQIKVIGVGNEWRGDDAAGILVARRLKEDRLPRVRFSECLGTVSDIQDAWKDAAGAIVVDAVYSGGPPGTIYRFDAHGAGMPVELSRSPSSHGWGVAEALALGKVFQELPPFLIIYGIAGKDFSPGRGLSPEVAAAVPETVRRLKQEILAWLGGAPPMGHPLKNGGQS